MKRFFLLLSICCSIVAFAEVVTMDLKTATDMASNPVTYGVAYGLGYYDGTDVWDSTYNDSGICQFIYTNEARFMLSHMPSLNSYGGMSWEGFTLSKVSQDTANVFGCVADGGLAGVGTPYVIGYFSEWVTEAQGFSSNIVLFDKEYYPEYVYICQNSNTMEAIANGGVFNARVFTAQDTLTLIISGLTTTLEETKSVIYYLAVDGEMNNGWVKVPLTALGKVGGLSFRMTTTDMGDFGANTPMYFAMDGLTVNTELPTNIQEFKGADTNSRGKIVMQDSQLMILKGNELYTLLGQRLK